MLTSYALWRVKDVQTGTNEILGACLQIELEENETGFTMENAWPISDEEGINLDGYHFNVINTCEEAVTYQIVLDSLEVTSEEQRMNPEYIKVELDNRAIRRYSDLLESSNEDINYIPIASKLVYTGTIPAKEDNINGKVSHTIKTWISEDSPNSEIGKEFKSKVRIIAGQSLPEPEYAITPESCFDFDSETGTITGYHADECTTDYLVVPATIDGVFVKNIDFYNGNYSGTIYINWGYVDLKEATYLETIGYSSFARYVGINKPLIIPNNVKVIEAYAFERYKGTNQELIIPDSVIEIGGSAFEVFDGKNLILGNNIKKIGYTAFSYYKGINQELIIPSSVEKIEVGAFYHYNGSNIILGGENLNYIGEVAFNDYMNTININMSETDFNNVNKANDWKNESAMLNFLKIGSN